MRGFRARPVLVERRAKDVVVFGWGGRAVGPAAAGGEKKRRAMASGRLRDGYGLGTKHPVSGKIERESFVRG